jgi:Flagellar transcriptional activator (FlhC)
MPVTEPTRGAERERLEVALRMIAHEARTCTIKACTGLSDDRIRRLYSTHFKDDAAVRRQRGKSPSRTRVFVKNAVYQSEAGTLAVLFAAFDIVHITAAGKVVNALSDAPLALGRQLCLAYETYAALHSARHLSFERAWSLLHALAAGEELVLLACRECQGLYVHHLLEIDAGRCPCCKLTGRQPLRQRASAGDFEARRAVADSLVHAVADAPRRLPR